MGSRLEEVTLHLLTVNLAGYSFPKRESEQRGQSQRHETTLLALLVQAASLWRNKLKAMKG